MNHSRRIRYYLGVICFLIIGQRGASLSVKEKRNSSYLAVNRCERALEAVQFRFAAHQVHAQRCLQMSSEVSERSDEN
ncbi:hypothetical protein B0J12DRAFT_639297 [Macrophomina phaseolina]|uniref:Secreted protein n=1 Tax=Macrophomina phaseolina TaxID=35725 RepID=A0ABQ8GV75_9PEZI|nr:hypothetical protein B0J12DRAFT_639297 [Macrophomina phaseolina]